MIENTFIFDCEVFAFGGYDEHGKKIKGSSLEIMVGECPCTIAYGGIHGAIPTYKENTAEK